MKAFGVTLCITALASAQDAKLKTVIMLNAPGLSTPQKNLNLVTNPADEAQSLDQLSLVGKRQQYMIGNELRQRYVNNVNLLSENYVISETHLQTPHNGKNILSMQSQMLGMYPASDYNSLNDWQ